MTRSLERGEAERAGDGLHQVRRGARYAVSEGGGARRVRGEVAAPWSELGLPLFSPGQPLRVRRKRQPCPCCCSSSPSRDPLCMYGARTSTTSALAVAATSSSSSRVELASARFTARMHPPPGSVSSTKEARRPTRRVRANEPVRPCLDPSAARPRHARSTTPSRSALISLLSLSALSCRASLC